MGLSVALRSGDLRMVGVLVLHLGFTDGKGSPHLGQEVQETPKGVRQSPAHKSKDDLPLHD